MAKDDGEIPDLLPGRAVPERAPARQEQVVVRPKVEPPADPNDLEFDIVSARGTELPWDSPFRPSEAPRAAEPELSLPVRSPSIRPAAAARASVRPAAGPSVRPAPPLVDLGFDSAGWDLDDDLGDPRAAQLNVAVPMKEKDDVPWPICRTPLPETLDVPAEAVQQALDLPDPGGWLSAPFYYWSARAALRRLAAETNSAAESLAQAEATRDRLLGDLARSLRPSLEGKDRFRMSYDQIDQHQRIVQEAKAGLTRADERGETGLAQLDVELATANATIGLRTRHTAERRALAESGQRDLARLRATLQRHAIERRNIVTRAQETSGPGAEMPPELAGRFLGVEELIKRSEAEIGVAQTAQKELDLQLRAAEEEERRALAEARRIEAKREGLILSQQGTLGELGETLGQAEAGLGKVLANVGLAIVELHGEVPVEANLRQQLLAADASVSAQARELELARRAAERVDVVAFQRGRGVLVGLGAFVLVLLGWLMVR